ncbi:tail fiber domain-containing protein [Xanthomarina sp. F2636L]|uniref:tail fiber domain-containing protein n=1 Tax=Xanthomarina sp. F2636L TaxID=2996018 RepID=UPI00225E38F5|nr:tail fiber domain-containing protein [Xanthomarina sp. F2636L]MCX7550477.1 tail fiber domain-containing protein [Xanthomarina sp. F2636L]
MKKLVFTLVFLITGITFAQQGIHYKALIKDGSGNILASAPVSIQFIIYEGAALTNNVYQESHAPTTDANGIVMVNIGEGTPISGTFNAIDWAADEHYLNVQINTGSGLTNMGTTQFMSVPYAKQAETATTAANVNGLETLDEGNGIGWRLIGRNPTVYDNIGENAVDLSSSNNNTSISSGASGSDSFASGRDTTASGQFSTAMGIATEASNERATAMGSFTTASGSSSTAMGSNTEASGNYSTAMGSGSTASGGVSTAMGHVTEASGDFSTAMGSSTTASGSSSTAMGNSTIASGSRSTAMGFNTEASGINSTALGTETTASGTYSTAMGRATNTSAWYSTAMGYQTKAEAYMSTAIGRFNVGGGASIPPVAPTDPLFELGNGSSDTNRQNALTVLKNGNLGITTNTPETKLQVTGGSDAGLNQSGGFVLLGETSGMNLVMDTNEIMVRNNGAAAPLYLQNDGGQVAVGGSIVHSSDRRLKRDIETLPYGLNEILQLAPKQYYWKNRGEQTHKSLGLIAQEVQPIISALVHTANDENQTLSVSYTELIPVLINAIQEQQDIIDKQQLKIESLTTESNQKDEALNAFDARLKQIESILNQTNQ